MAARQLTLRESDIATPTTAAMLGWFWQSGLYSKWIFDSEV